MNWTEANQRYLMSALDGVRAVLEQRATVETPAEEMSPGPALETLCKLFGLSPFERAVLLMCAGMELDSKFADLCAKANGDPHRDYPTFCLALGALPDAHWSALTPDAPLRRWRLVELQAGSNLTRSRLRIDERVLHFLTGVTDLDERLAGIVEPMPAPMDLVKSQRAIAEHIANVLRDPVGAGLPVIQLCGNDASAKRAVAAAGCASVGLNLHALAAEVLPNDARDLESLVRLWEREAALATSALLIECEEVENHFAPVRFIERVNSVLFVSSRERLRLRHRESISFDVLKPTSEEQHALWRSAGVNGQVEALATQFDLSAASIRTAAARSKSPEQLWTACRAQARPRLDNLAQRIDPRPTWNEIVLPTPQLARLREIAAHVRQRAKVYETWGFAQKCARGFGVSALFAGSSGTGKTFAARSSPTNCGWISTGST